jgi:hypothetical protein
MLIVFDGGVLFYFLLYFKLQFYCANSIIIPWQKRLLNNSYWTLSDSVLEMIRQNCKTC